jgi:hypothetical protein
VSRSSATQILYTPRPDTTPEVELSVLAAVYKFVLFDSQANEGDPHDLTNRSTKECTTSQDTKGTQNADLHCD